MVVAVCVYIVIFSDCPVNAAGPGTFGADFINLSIGSRAIGMGSAQSAVGKDASVMYCNPAGLGNLKTGNLTSMHSSFWLSDVSYTFIGCAIKSNKTVLGIGGTMLSMDDISRTTDSPTPVGTFAAQNNLAVVSVCQELLDGIYAGVSGKVIYSAIDEVTSTSYDADAGFFYKSTKGLTLGVAVRNMLESEVKYDGQSAGDKLLRTYRAGVGYELPRLLTVAADLDYYNNGSLDFSVGAEASLAGMLNMRVGEKFNVINQDTIQKIGEFSMGVGINYESIVIDCSMLPFSGFGSIYSISITMNFGKETIEY